MTDGSRGGQVSANRTGGSPGDAPPPDNHSKSATDIAIAGIKPLATDHVPISRGPLDPNIHPPLPTLNPPNPKPKDNRLPVRSDLSEKVEGKQDGDGAKTQKDSSQ